MERIVCDPMGPNVDLQVFNDNLDWTEFYGDVEEELLPKIPEPRGRVVSIYSFVDSDQSGNSVTRCLHTVNIIFIQNAPIIWFSKKHNAVEVITFERKLFALRI